MSKQLQEKLLNFMESGHIKVDQSVNSIRDLISIGKLVRKNDGPEEVEQILDTMSKYGEIKV